MRPHDTFRTTKHRTIKLGGYVHCILGTLYKISPEFEGQGQRSKVKVTKDKKRKTAESSPLTMHSRACVVARPYAARSNRRYHCVPPGGDGLRRWEDQGMLSSSSMSVEQCCSLYTSVVGIYYLFVMFVCAISLCITMGVLRLYHYQPHSCQMPNWVSSSYLRQ